MRVVHFIVWIACLFVLGSAVAFHDWLLAGVAMIASVYAYVTYRAAEPAIW